MLSVILSFSQPSTDVCVTYPLLLSIESLEVPKIMGNPVEKSCLSGFCWLIGG